MEIVFNSYVGYLDWRDETIKAALNGNGKCFDLLVKAGVNPKIITENYRVELRYILDGFVAFRYVDDGDSSRIEVYVELQENDEDDLYDEDNQELIVFIKAYGGI